MSSRYGPRKLLNLDLGQPLAAIPRPQKPYGGVCVTAWLAGRPVALFDILESDLPMSPAALANRLLEPLVPLAAELLFGDAYAGAWPRRSGRSDTPGLTPELLAELKRAGPLLPAMAARIEAARKGPPSAGPPNPSLSLVICTRDRPKQLERLFTSLGQLRPAPDEVIVVDNAPSDTRTRDLVRELGFARYLVEPKPGLSAARNLGIAAANCALIAFTDDDAIVAADWVAGLKRGFADPRVMAVTGLVLPAALETEAQVVFQAGRNDEFTLRRLQPVLFDEAFFSEWKGRGVPCWRLGAGVNMAFRREAFAEVGLFDERLGAGAAGCSEDSELWYRLLAAGHACRYEPTAVVWHHHRESRAALRRQSYDYMRGHVAALLVQAVEHRHPGNLRRAFFGLPRYYLRQALAGMLLGFDARRGLWPWEVAGILAGLATSAGLALRPKHRALPRLEAAVAESAS